MTCCAARQQTKVKCTFDDDDGHRQHAIEEMLKDPDAATASKDLADSRYSTTTAATRRT